MPLFRRDVALPVTDNDGTMKLVFGIEYDGSAYYGWQRQKELASVQACLEHAISTVADETVSIYGAGRTDAGVHATGQVVHFETRSRRSYAAWALGVNANLPADIAVRWVTSVPDDFHARFSATARRYRYIIYNHPLRSALLSRGLTYCYYPIDAPAMARAGQCLLGENDFTSFRSLQCQSTSPWRNVHYLHVTRQGYYVVIDIKANAFMHHMVRNIVGSLLIVGSGNQSENWVSDLLAYRDRTQAGPTARAEGLYLVGIDYPSRFILPTSSSGPLCF
ncbi:tRNA pseudouridine(38-40) synthase TruA [Candidatus Doolittlea endobia]|uniref:tRNA pseudouridine synthase A n=1 Tax=Candidatus Doolittlea endobia TaxID=1778262 RepID=A0A143WSB5_9ENTR|nr:tRNA pseudouridine(38-40) synthase TruA [Candidatus Doolittlea endobia]CUX96645.1 tRNA pseudouridine synthase A [Candidatus Doolittlea endobia]